MVATHLAFLNASSDSKMNLFHVNYKSCKEFRGPNILGNYSNVWVLMQLSAAAAGTNTFMATVNSFCHSLIFRSFKYFLFLSLISGKCNAIFVTNVIN